jgi:TonB-dependent receptor
MTGNAMRVEAAPAGKITGTVTDASDGNPLMEARVTAMETGGTAAADPKGFALTYTNGRYVLDIPAGTYRLTVTHDGYEAGVQDMVRVEAGKTLSLDFALASEVFEIDEMEVVEKALDTSEMFQLLKRKETPVIADSIAAETIAKLPESDVAGILTRVPGVTLAKGKFMQARGMPPRYNKTTLNGSILPTTRPNEKETPLDLFPAGIVDSIDVVKTFTPDLPGNFSGGLCQIKTKAVPNDFMMNFKATANYNTETTFDDYLTYHGGSKDWLGYDDGTRALPGIIPNDKKVSKKANRPGGYTARELEAMGEAFENTWNTYEKNAPLNGDYSFYVGDRFNKFGAILALNYKNEIHNRSDERLSTYYFNEQTGQITQKNNYDFTRSTYVIKEGGLFNMGLDISPDHKIYLNQFLDRNATDETVTYQGYSEDVGNDIRVTRLRWMEEQIYTSQLAGEHTVESFLRSMIKWQYNYADGRLYDPDMRTYTYDKIDEEYRFSTKGSNPSRQWTDQQETMHTGKFDWNITLPELSWLLPKLQAGAAYNYRDRDFNARRFNFDKKTGSPSYERIDVTKDVEYIMQPRYINEYTIELTEGTRTTDSYTARQSTSAGYCLLDLTLFKKFQLVTGGRYEKDHIDVTTFSPLNPDSPVASTLKDDPWLPSYSLKYAPTDGVNIRLHYSETVDRPEFHELAPYEFTDVVGGGDIVGNPNLQSAEIKNYDVRVEWFINPTDVLALSYFYKDITNAIEPGLQGRTSLTLSYLNAASAYLWGIEFELRKNLGFITPWLKYYNLTGSYLYSDSETEVEPQPFFISASGTRPLAGQPRHLANITLEYDNPEWGFTGRFMYQLASERLSWIGVAQWPDIYQEQQETFDVVLIKKFGKHYEFKFVAQNLSDEETTYTQGGAVYQTWEDGMTFKLGFSYKW